MALSNTTAGDRKRTADASTPLNWKSETQHHRYSINLLAALRRVRNSTPAPRPRAVREAADRALAVSAAGRTRWSRAILFNRSINLNSAARKRRRAAASSPALRPPHTASGSVRKTPELVRKAKVLGRLVPGCRKLAFPTLLAETSDYIAALQMQIRAMTALTQMIGTTAAPPV